MATTMATMIRNIMTGAMASAMGKLDESGATGLAVGVGIIVSVNRIIQVLNLQSVTCQN